MGIIGTINFLTLRPSLPEGEGVYHDSLWVHEWVHCSQVRRYGRVGFFIYYRRKRWALEREAYYAQLCFLIQSGRKESRFAWLRDIMEMDYGQRPEEVEELLDEVGI